MNTLRNKVQLIGRLGAKADFKVLDNGNTMARISLATNEVYKNNKGERIEDTTWHQLVAWGKTAEIINKYTDKGSEIAIEGKLINRTYTDKQGVKKYITEIQVNDLVLLGDKNKAEA
ncbi:single-stranded DNA-binding protein [Echinicola sp. CAU 1574]|uniref:Single-stranded DNA-binding protein n=1 Tax=Echinicola arenosa TaxID=2774144 RepID=A0ABR9AQC7_9BACT|nr:single-stranded DNA-binding protein [Echinicola arenosa]MBD8490994.1 single-stranded DNA-binding protein [Echinicola arenosa]